MENSSIFLGKSLVVFISKLGDKQQDTIKFRRPSFLVAFMPALEHLQ